MLSLAAALFFAVGEAPAAAKRGGNKVPAGLNITVAVPKKAPTLDDVKNGTPVATVTLTNTGKKDLTLWPFMAARLFDDKGKAAKLVMRLGRFGLTWTDSALEAVEFLTLKPGKSHQFKVALSTYPHDPESILGWEVPGAGTYRLVLHYKYDRKAEKKRLGKGCKDIDKANKPWNQAAEVDKKMVLKIKVKT
jgi:hypothetical protein